VRSLTHTNINPRWWRFHSGCRYSFPGKEEINQGFLLLALVFETGCSVRYGSFGLSWKSLCEALQKLVWTKTFNSDICSYLNACPKKGKRIRQTPAGESYREASTYRNACHKVVVAGSFNPLFAMQCPMSVGEREPVLSCSQNFTKLWSLASLIGSYLQAERRKVGQLVKMDEPSNSGPAVMLPIVCRKQDQAAPGRPSNSLVNLTDGAIRWIMNTTAVTRLAVRRNSHCCPKRGSLVVIQQPNFPHGSSDWDDAITNDGRAALLYACGCYEHEYQRPETSSWNSKPGGQHSSNAETLLLRSLLADEDHHIATIIRW